MKTNSILLRDIKRIIKNNYRKLLWISVIIAFLFYLFNMFVSLGIRFDDINKLVTDKIGIYFYIDDTQADSDQIYKRIINIKDQLSSQDIEVNFSSKDDAFSFLETKIPEITKNFDKFGIENPLPSTLYVMFDNKNEYEIMKDIIIQNKDIILNIKDIDQWASLQQQENRSLRILNIMELLQNSIYFVIIMLSIIIISFTQHLLKSFFFEAYKELQTKKLLWATHKDANGWFILTLLFTITIWFLISLIITCITFTILNHNILHALNIDIQLCNMIFIFIGSYAIFSLVATALWYQRLKRLEKKF